MNYLLAGKWLGFILLKWTVAFAALLLSVSVSSAQDAARYSCADYLRELPSGDSPAFLQALGFTYGAYYMSNWEGSLTVDEAKMKRFDATLIANCRAQPSEAFSQVALQTAHDFRK